MFENKIINWCLDRLPKKYWNNFSRFLSFFSLRTIGSPIRFSYGGFTLQEYDIQAMPPCLREKFLEFCYPADSPEQREKEVRIDEQYWPATSTFIVKRNSDLNIVGCIQFIQRVNGVKLPVEYSRVTQDTDSRELGGFLGSRIPRGSFSEIYRCRRSANLAGREGLMVVLMLFKAAWAKIIQTGTEFSLITFSADSMRLRNMYVNKLAFQDTGVSVQYEGNPKEWRLFVRNQADMEENFANLSKGHFAMQTWFRMNLKKKSLEVKPVAKTPEPVITEEETMLFADVTTAKKLNRKPFPSKISAK